MPPADLQAGEVKVGRAVAGTRIKMTQGVKVTIPSRATSPTLGVACRRHVIIHVIAQLARLGCGRIWEKAPFRMML